MPDDRIEGAAELSFAREVLSISGDHVKIAGTPAELQKEATGATEKKDEDYPGIKKIAEMSLREIFQDTNFRRGVMEEIDSSRPTWEPAVEAFVKAHVGME